MTTEPIMEAFEDYFERADLNQDGKINGSEAVAFFEGFGLPKQVLAQIWSYADQKRTGFLGRPEFFNALRLVTVAQTGHSLTPNMVKSTLYGPAAGMIPPPQIKSAAAAHPPQATPGPSPTPQGDNPALPPSSEMGTHVSFSQLNPLQSSGTGSNQVQQTQAQTSSALGVLGSGTGQPQPQWPKMTKSDVNKYTKMFHEVDKDRDGRIAGFEARNLFLSWKLPREILKQVWDLSDQDSDGMLTLREFCIALYLMERHRQGYTLPKSLPDSLKYDEALPASGLPASAYAGPNWQQNPDVEDEDLQKAIKASLQTAIQEGISVLQLCDPIGGTDMQSPASSIPTVQASGRYEFGTNYIPTISTNSAPSAPPLDSISTESFFPEHHVCKIEEHDSSNVNLGMCSTCIEEPVEGACIPCGHMAGCMGCLQKIKETGGECPICRANIVLIVKLYSV